MSCRLWPSVCSFQPAILQAAAEATAACLVENKHKVLWVPRADSETNGAWVSADQACLLPSVTGPEALASNRVVNVGRRAGLQISNAPQHVLQACLVHP